MTCCDPTPPKTVIVRAPCACGASRWWDCTCPELARYEVATHDTVPDASQLAWIRKEYPTADLIY